MSSEKTSQLPERLKQLGERGLLPLFVRSQRVEHGLYVCNDCGLVANADCNGAENIRQKVLLNLATDGGDKDNGWLAQPATRLFDRTRGAFFPRSEAGCES